MIIRASIVTSLVLAIGAPVLAHCGNCGSGKKASSAGHDHDHAEIGEPAPAFKLAGIDGESYRLSDYKGKVVVLEWTNHQCPVVNRYHDTDVMTETLAKFKGKPVVWLAIDSSHFAKEKRRDIKSWAKAQKLPYMILLDHSGEIGRKYGAKTTPHVFVIDQKGKLAYMGSPDNDPYGDKESGVRNYVEEAVSALLKGSTVATATTKPFGCSVKYKK